MVGLDPAIHDFAASTAPPLPVMVGLDPAIHDFAASPQIVGT